MRAQRERVVASTARAIFGGTFGGMGPAVAGERPAKRLKLAADETLLFPHGTHMSFYRELIHSFMIRDFVDYCAGRGDGAIAAVDAGIRYTGFVLNAAHKEYVEGSGCAAARAILKRGHLGAHRWRAAEVARRSCAAARATLPASDALLPLLRIALARPLRPLGQARVRDFGDAGHEVLP